MILIHPWDVLLDFLRMIEPWILVADPKQAVTVSPGALQHVPRDTARTPRHCSYFTSRVVIYGFQNTFRKTHRSITDP